jgi:hypothetical protein
MPSKGWDHLGTRGGGSGPLFFSVGGCESGYIANSAANPNIFYAGCYGGSLSRFDYATGQGRAINVWPENPMGQSSIDLIERVQWTFPIVFSHHDAKVLYVGSQKVWKTTDEGQSWTAISPDLTRHAPETMGASGGPITKDQTGVETYATVFAIAPSYHDANVIWVGSDDGLVHVTRNGGDTWTNVTPKDAPPFLRINTIEASPTAPGKAYVAGIRYLVDNDRAPYVWKTTDYGVTWTKIVNGIPQDDFVRAVREDPARPGLLYAASERTVYVSWDDGATWQPLSLNLPTVQVSDLVVKDNDVVVATHGRSFWMLRNIAPLRQLTSQVASATIHLFDPVDPVRDVDNGVEVFYYLVEAVDTLTLEFLDADGAVIQKYTGTRDARRGEEEEDDQPSFFGGGRARTPAVTAGSHAFTWNLRYPGYTDFEGRIFWAAGTSGPSAVPGRYQVRLTAGDMIQTQEFEITIDPRIADQVTVAQLQERFDFAIQIRDRVSDANEAVIWIRNIKTAIDERLETATDRAVTRQAATVKERLSAVEGEIYQVRNQSNQDPLNFPIKLNNKLAALMGVVESGEARPTDQSRTVYAHLDTLLQRQLDQMNTVMQTDLARLNELLRGQNLEAVEVEKPKREVQ